MMIALMLLGITVGDFPIPASDALTTALWDRSGEYHFVINSLRFPRITVAVLAGMCLAASGAIFQSLVGNPLVSPDIIGINNGAATCAVFIVAAGGNVSLLPCAAFAGALTKAIVIYVLAWKKGGQRVTPSARRYRQQRRVGSGNHLRTSPFPHRAGGRSSKMASWHTFRSVMG